MNPFNQSRFRQEHTLGDSYKIVKEVHDKLDEVKLVADNISNFRSGNIELRGVGSSIFWKYTEGIEWFLLMDTTDMFAPLLQEIASIEGDIDTLTSDIAGNALAIENSNTENALAIESTNTEASALELRVSGLASQGVIDAKKIATNASDISAINTELVGIKDSISILSRLISEQTTNLSNALVQLDTLQGTVTSQGLSIIDITSRIDALESV